MWDGMRQRAVVAVRWEWKAILKCVRSWICTEAVEGSLVRYGGNVGVGYGVG